MPGFSQFKNYFHFNRAERRGLVVLFCILLALLFTNLSLPLFNKKKQYDFTEFEKSVNKFMKQQALYSDSIKNLDLITKNRQSSFSELKPFPFDPNNLPKDQWFKMGLSEKQVKVIKNYEKKGGRFVKPDDLSKIYSISDKDFQILRPFIQIADVIEKNNQKQSTNGFSDSSSLDEQSGIIVLADSGLKIDGNLSSSNTILAPAYGTRKHLDNWLNINLADTLDLRQLKGIGPSYARRIIKYRKLLGGYIRKEQLLEVYGMDSTRFNGFMNDFFIDSLNIRKLNVNTASIKDLIAHPYIEYYVAKTLIRSREEKGDFSTFDEIKNRTGIPDELFQKISPYLCL